MRIGHEIWTLALAWLALTLAACTGMRPDLAGWDGRGGEGGGCCGDGVNADPLVAKELARGPRKVILGTCMNSTLWAPFPGFEQRLAQLGGLVDEMAKQAQAKYGPDAHLDLAVLPEYAVTSGKKGPAQDRCVPLAGKVADYFGAKARQHHTYLVVAMELADDAPHGGSANAAVLFDRQGKVAGIYRKVHLAASPGDQNLEGGMTPGRAVPVFECDFGKVGLQICFDMVYDDGWAELARQGAQIVAWPTQSPATIQPAARALTNRYYIVSSTWRNNASIFDPTGAVVGQISKPEERVLTAQVDLSYALVPWQPKLNNGKVFTEKYGDRAGYRYSEREDGGIFWSNDPSKPIGDMVRELGLMTWGELLEYNNTLREKVLKETGR